ncbi:hypothetical protein EDD94_4432 [Streptomyces sp. PanSC9]|nr:hypothetical protein EDD94_4432 [Streptomyces sp. PanSC9]
MWRGNIVWWSAMRAATMSARGRAVHGLEGDRNERSPGRVVRGDLTERCRASLGHMAARNSSPESLARHGPGLALSVAAPAVGLSWLLPTASGNARARCGSRAPRPGCARLPARRPGRRPRVLLLAAGGHQPGTSPRRPGALARLGTLIARACPADHCLRQVSPGSDPPDEPGKERQAMENFATYSSKGSMPISARVRSSARVRCAQAAAACPRDATGVDTRDRVVRSGPARTRGRQRRTASPTVRRLTRADGEPGREYLGSARGFHHGV